ncbi:MAG TPA: ASCH domain-containing protein [Phycisphaeraceae bacterium]
MHVAILMPAYLRMILKGRKTIESRLSSRKMPPYRMIQAGQRIFFKASGGPFRATAIAQHVDFYDDLTPQRVRELRQRFQGRICADEGYWRAKQRCRYATLIHLAQVEPIDTGPRYRPSSYLAWFVLPDEANPLLDVELTSGAIRNHYVSIHPHARFFPEALFTLRLPDGQTIQTSLYRQRRIGWRGWGRYFQQHQLQPGDRVRFVALDSGEYRVTWATNRLNRHADPPHPPA